MKFSKFLILIDLKSSNQKKLLIHGLLGYSAILNKDEVLILSRWQDTFPIHVKTSDRYLFDYLKKYKFIIDEIEEKQLENKIHNELMKIDSKRLDSPKDISLIFSYKCNFKCPYCFENPISQYKNDVMTKNQIDVIFSNPKNESGNVQFYGGEPLLMENYELIEYVINKRPHAKYSIITNGYNLVEYYDLLKKIDLQYIQVTLDGEENSHNRTRVLREGGGSYSKIMKGIELYIDNGIQIKIRMNINERNRESCISLKKYLETKYPDSPFLNFELQALFQYSPQQKKEINETIIEDALDSNNNVIFNTIHPLVKRFVKETPIHPIFRSCEAIYRTRFYDPYNYIYSCYLAVGNANKAIGKYYPNWKSNQVSMLTETIDSSKKCKACRLKYLCGGGCLNYEVNEKEEVVVSCTNITNILENVLPMAYNITKNDILKEKQI